MTSFILYKKLCKLKLTSARGSASDDNKCIYVHIYAGCIIYTHNFNSRYIAQNDRMLAESLFFQKFY